MNKNKFSYLILFSIVCLLGLFSCNDDDAPDSARLFKPRITVDASEDNQFKISWMSQKGAVNYKVEVSRDSFLTIDQSVIVNTGESSVIVKNLLAAQDYNIRVMAVHQDTTLNSKWNTASGTTYSIFTNPNSSMDIIDIGFRVKWERRGSAVDSIQVLLAEDSTDVLGVKVSDDEAAQASKIVLGLKPNTKYIVNIFSGKLLRGKGLVSTRSTVTNAIDLREIDADRVDQVLVDTIAIIPENAVILLKRGHTYNLTSTPVLSKSITFMSGYDFIPDLATINIDKNFAFENGAEIGNISFTNLNLQGTESAYLMQSNNSSQTKIGTISFEGCNMLTFRGVFRIRNAEIIDNLRINNCTVDFLKDYGLVRIESLNNVLSNITITNSTITNAQRLVIRSAFNTSIEEQVKIENCTFYNTPQSGNYMVDYGTNQQLKGDITISNCIFGSVKGETEGRFRVPSSIRVSVQNSYATDDFKVSAAIPDLEPYNGTSSALFEDAENGRFNFKDASFSGRTTVGDPRWRTSN